MSQHGQQVSGARVAVEGVAAIMSAAVTMYVANGTEFSGRHLAGTLMAFLVTAAFVLRAVRAADEWPSARVRSAQRAAAAREEVAPVARTLAIEVPPTVTWIAGGQVLR